MAQQDNHGQRQVLEHFETADTEDFECSQHKEPTNTWGDRYANDPDQHYTH